MPAKNEIEILVTAEVDRALKNVNKLKKTTEKTTKGIGTKLNKLKGIWVALGGVIATTVVLGFKKVIKVASDAQETFSKFDTVFKKVGASASKVAKDFARDFGLSDLAAKRLLGTTGDILTGFGFTSKSALKLSKDLNELAVDLASFQNISTARASEALTKALTGETESLKLLGIVIRQDTKEFRENIAAIQATQGVSLQQAKSLEILRQATIQSKNAVGDFARTQNQFANQQKVLNKNIENFIVFLGSGLLPLATKVIKAMNDFVQPLKDAVKQIIEFNKKFSITFRAAAAGMFILKTSINSVKLIFKSMIGTFIDGLVFVSRTVRDFAFLFIQNIATVKQAFEDIFSGKGLVNSAKKALSQVGDNFKNFGENISSNSDKFAKSVIAPFVAIGKDTAELFNKLKNGREQDLEDQKTKSGESIAVVKEETIALTEEQILRNELLSQLALTKQQIEKERIAELVAIRKDALEQEIISEQEFTALTLEEIAKRSAAEKAATKLKIDLLTSFGDAFFEANKNITDINKVSFRDSLKAAVGVIAGRLKALAKAEAVLAFVPPPVGGPHHGVAAGLLFAGATAVNALGTAAIDSFENGGVSDGGLAIVGEAGRELVRLPAGAQVSNHTQTNKTLNNQRSLVIENVNLPNVSNGEQFYEEMQNYQRQHGEL